MKAKFKQLSKKTLSCILALAVILCSVTVMFSAFATEEPAETVDPYTVSYRSPAIPMFVGKQVMLKDLEIDFSEADGDTYAGDEVIWSAPEGDSAQILGGGFYAKKTGITKFTATYGGKVRNIYVIVNETGNYDFELVNLDLTKEGEGGYVASDWVASNANSYSANDLAIAENVITHDKNGGIRGPWTRGTLLYNNAMLKEFADYTYEAYIHHGLSSEVSGPISVTLITRAQHNTAVGDPLFVGGKTSGNALGVQFALYGGPSIVNTAKGTTDSYENVYHFYWTPSQFHTLPLSNVNYGTTETSYAFSQNHNYSVKLSGDDLVVKVEDTVVLDTSAETVYRSYLSTSLRQSTEKFPTDLYIEERDSVTGSDVSNVVSNTTLQAGTIGFGTSYTSGIYLKTVRVLLNITEDSVMPNLQDPAFYIVKAASPAIPMFEDKVVALSDIALEIGGNLISGDLAEWTVTEGENVIIVGDALYAVNTGIAKLTAKYGEETQTVYVIANQEGDYDFYLVNLDYANSTTADLRSDWMYAVSHNGGYWPNRRAAATQMFYKLENNFVSYHSTEKAMQTGYTYSRGGMLLYNAPILSNFADYTLVTDINNYGYSGDQTCFVGLAVRVNANFGATTVTSLAENTAVDTLSSASNIFTLANGSLGSGMYLQHRQYGAVLLGSYNNSAEEGNTSHAFGKINAGTESLPLHSLTDDNWTKTLGYIASSKNAEDLNSDGTEDVVRPDINYAPTADPNYVLNPYAGDGDWVKTTAANAVKHTVEVQLSGKDIVYSINGNEILNTTKQMYQVSATNGLAVSESQTFHAEFDETTGEYLASETVTTGAVTNTEYSRDTYLEKFETAGVATAGNAIGFTNFQEGMYIYNLKVKLNGTSENTMPNLQDPTFYVVKDASPAIPMYAGKFVDFSDIIVEIGGKLVSADDITWTVADGSAIVINGGIYAAKAGTTTLTAEYNGTTKNIYVIANNEGENVFYLVNEELKTATLPANTWYYADKTFGGNYANNWSNGAVTSLVTTSNATNGYSMGNPWEGGNNSRALFYKSAVLEDFADYTVLVGARHVSENIRGSFLNVVLRADLTDNIAVGTDMLASGSTALSLGIRPIGGLSIYGYGATSNPAKELTLHTVSDTSLIKPNSSDISYLFGNIADIGASANSSTFRDISIKLEGNDILYKLDGKTILDTTKDIKTLSFATGGSDLGTDASLYTDGTMTKDAYNTYMDGYNLDKGTVGLVWVRSGYNLSYFKVSLNDTVDDLPIMREPDVHTLSNKDPVIPMTAGYKVDTNNFLIDVNGALSVASDYTWTTNADAEQLEVTDGVIYAHQKGTYTLTGTKGTSTKTVYVVVKNPNDTSYVVYDADYRTKESDDYTNVWQTTLLQYGANLVETLAGKGYTVADKLDGSANYNSVSSWEYTTMSTLDPDGNQRSYTSKVAYNGYVPVNVNSIVVDAKTAGALSNDFGADGMVYAYSVLENDAVNALTNYKVTTTIRGTADVKGMIGVFGRASGFEAGTYNLLGAADGGSVVGFAMGNGGDEYKNNGVYSTDISGRSQIADSTSIFVRALGSTGWADRPLPVAHTYTVEFNGTTATFGADNTSQTITQTVAETSGSVGVMSAMVTGWNSIQTGPVTSILDFKVELVNADSDAFKPEKFADVTETVEEATGYTDLGDYTFTADGNVISSFVGGAISNTQKVTIPADYTLIAKDGYYNYPVTSYNYQTVTIENKTSYTGSNNVEFLKEIDMSAMSSVTIGGTAFFGAVNLEKITFPETVKKIGFNAFAKAGLTEVDLSRLNGGIIQYAFRFNYSLKSVDFGKVTSIGSNAFEQAMSLKEAILPDTLTTISQSAFNSCYSLEKVRLPENSSFVALDASTFRNCYSLEEISIPANVATIAANVFNGCTSLNTVKIYNPDCVITDSTSIPANEGMVIYGYTGSTAEAYANANSITFVAFDDIENNTMPANAAFNLNSLSIAVGEETVAGSNIAWVEDRNATYEVSNGWLLAYAEGEITVTGKYGDETVTLDIVIGAKGADTALEVTTIADANMTIAPVANDATAYTVTINETDSVALKYGTLTVTADNCDAVKVVNATDSTGKVFGFNVIKPETMVLAAEYTTLAERETSIYPLGAQVRPKTNTYTAGIRFITRFPEIKMEPAGIFLDEAYTQAGVLVIPYVLWDGTTLPDADALAETDVPMGDYSAQNVVIKNLMTANEAYADAAALLTGIPSSMYSVDIMALPYVIGTDGVVTYIDGDPMIKNYSEVLEASYPKYTNADDLFYGGTDHDIDGIASTTSLSYETGEDITFALNLKGAYTLDWTLDKDDPDVNAIADLGEINGSTTLVKTGTFDPAKDGSIFTLTTKMNAAGIVRLMVTFKDVNGTVIDTIYMSAAADYENITQSLEEGFTADALVAELTNTEGTGYYDTWTAAWDTQVAAVNTAITADAGLADWLAGTKAAGDEYTIDGMLKLKVAAVVTGNNPYTSYHFWIATTGDYGITTTGADGFFKDGNFNNRPATGSFSVPTGAAANSLNMKAEFAAYGETTGGTGAPTADTVTVRMNSHGMDNDISSAAKTTLKSKSPSEGGIYEPISDMTGDDPTAVYQYGILRRDYTAMQVAKHLFADILKDGEEFAVATSGGSMGAWQAVTVGALDEDVNNIRASITWMCQIGAKEYGDITSWHPDYNKNTTTEGARVFSTVTAARIINDRVVAGDKAFTFTLAEAGLGDYQASAPHGVIALYNAFDGADENITKSANFYQFKEHGAQVYGTYTNFVSALSNK